MCQLVIKRQAEAGARRSANCLTVSPMDPLKTYDYLTLSRQRVFEWVRPLRAEQYAQEFSIGLGSIARTLTHMLLDEWYYVQRMERNDLPPYEQWPIQQEKPLALAELERAWIEQAERTRSALRAVRDWSAEFDYRVTDDDGKLMNVTLSAGDILTHMTVHEAHHRAQVMNMLRQLGVTVEAIDYDAMMHKRREAVE